MSRAHVEVVLEALAAALHDRAVEPAEESEKVLTLEEASQWLGVSTQMVYRLMRRGELGSIVVGSRRLVLVSSITRLINGSGPALQDDEGRYAAKARVPKVRPIRGDLPASRGEATSAIKTPVAPTPRSAAIARGVTRPLRVATPAGPVAPTETATTVLTIEEAAEKLQCGKGRVRAMLRDGRLTHISVGHRVFVSAPDVMLLVAAASAAQ